MKAHQITTLNRVQNNFQVFQTEALTDQLDIPRIQTTSISIEKLHVFQCNLCPFMLNANIDLVNHITAEHPPKDQPKCIAFHCDLCPFQSKLRIHLRKHIESTHVDINCEYCPFTTTLKSIMKKHIEIHEAQQIVLHICNFCDSSFTSQSELSEHVEANHIEKASSNNS